MKSGEIKGNQGKSGEIRGNQEKSWEIKENHGKSGRNQGEIKGNQGNSREIMGNQENQEKSGEIMELLHIGAYKNIIDIILPYNFSSLCRHIPF